MYKDDRLPPHNIEAELSVLGSILINKHALGEIQSELAAADFYRESHAVIYEAMLDVYGRGEATDPVVIAQDLRSKSQLENVGGMDFLSSLVDLTPNSVRIKHYADIVKRTSILRQLITAAQDISEIGYENSPDTDDSIGRAENLISEIRQKQKSRPFEHIEDIVSAYLEPSSIGDADSGMKTGFNELDKLIGGLQPSNMIVLAARPSIGKSALAFNLALNVADLGKKVAIFSLEMGCQQVALRMVSNKSEVNMHTIRTHRRSNNDDQRIINAVGALSDLDIFVDDTPFQTIQTIANKARQLKLEQQGLDFIIIDYMQLIDGGQRWGQPNRVQEVSEISRRIKGMARDLDVPVLALSQLSRAIEQRPNRRPMLSDLRESGSIEQDADIVMFIYRAAKNMTEQDWIKEHPEVPYPRNLVELIVEKHRNGPTGSIELVVRDEVGKFAAPAPSGDGAAQQTRGGYFSVAR